MAARAGGNSAPPAEVEAVAASWMLEFCCCCLCRHFGDGCLAEFQRWSDVAYAFAAFCLAVAMATWKCWPSAYGSCFGSIPYECSLEQAVVFHTLINGLSKIPAHQKKTVYLCQLLIRIAKGKKLECHFENYKRISPLESALSFWTLLEREEIQLEKLHKDIRQLIQIQSVAVYMENGYFKEAAEALQRLFTGSESDKPLRMKLAIIIKSKDPYVPLLQTFSYDFLIKKIKSYIELFMKGNETNFLLQAATKEVESQGLGAIIALQSKAVNADENDKENLETKQRLTKEQHSIADQSPGDIRNPTVRPHAGGKLEERTAVQSLNGLQNVEKHGHALVSVRKRQRWTYNEDLKLKSGVKEFGVGNWTKILVHGDFNNRTSVMLKDRWRTLCKIKQG